MFKAVRVTLFQTCARKDGLSRRGPVGHDVILWFESRTVLSPCTVARKPSGMEGSAGSPAVEGAVLDSTHASSERPQVLKIHGEETDRTVTPQDPAEVMVINDDDDDGSSPREPAEVLVVHGDEPDTDAAVGSPAMVQGGLPEEKTIQEGKEAGTLDSQHQGVDRRKSPTLLVVCMRVEHGIVFRGAPSRCSQRC